jgi:hypothetical protein
LKLIPQILAYFALSIALGAPTNPALAMTFSLNKHTVIAGGEIVSGDARALKAFLKSGGIKSDVDNSFEIVLSSPGGNLFEGMNLGRVIREAGLSTTVARAQTCASACALAYLGGFFIGAAADAIGRQLEYGALLGFHGFAVERDKVILMNESLESSRVVSALILAYAEEMGGVDLGWLAQKLNVSASAMYFARTPADIKALSISVIGLPRRFPEQWHLNVCRKAIEPFRPQPDRIEDRTKGRSEAIRTIKELRQAVIRGRFGDSSTGLLFESLGDSDALDLVMAEPFYLNQKKPILDARSVELERGAGLYFDRCLVVRSKASVGAILLDAVGQRVILKEFDENAGTLALYPDDQQLW